LLIEETRQLLNMFGIFLNKVLDEQQLVDIRVIRRLIEAAELNERDTVLEIGAGCGNITVTLADVARKVIAVEKNAKFIPLLRERLATFDNIDLIHDDALRIKLPLFNKLVSNIPYSICEAMLQRLIYLDFEKAVLLVSSSFANIVTAESDDPCFSRLSLVANTFFDINKMEDVTPESYLPPPAGITSIIVLKPREAGDLSRKILRCVLMQRDRKLKNAMREALIASRGVSTKREARKLIRSMGIGEAMLEKRMARLSLLDLRLLLEKITFVHLGLAQPRVGKSLSASRNS
jgi:16S rRNA (adenine1518-N6/adenine1519-N6)-dimethyltransferase